MFATHPDVEVLRQPRSDDGVERLNPHDAADSWKFRVRAGVETIRCGEPGWRLGFARDAVNSWENFRALCDKGALPLHLRFPVSIPMVNSAAPMRVFETAADCAKVRAGYAQALARELQKILANIPRKVLAIQWDCATELQEAYPGALEAQLAQLAASNIIPSDTALGYPAPARVCDPRDFPDRA